MSLPRFGVARPVPVNILMWSIILAGAWCAATMTREFFPDSTPTSCTVTLVYPGATPEEIEQSLARKVEDAIAVLDEVEQVTTTISEGGGGIVVEFRHGIDATRGTREVERAVDALRDLPDEAEEIVVAEFDPVLPTIMLNLYGSADEESTKRAIRAIREDLEDLPGMGDILLSGVRDYEVRVDLDLDRLVQHGIALPEAQSAISAWMAEVPGGTVRTGTGDVNVRLIGVERRAAEIRRIPVRAGETGELVVVGDLGRVREDYVDREVRTRFRTSEGGGPSAGLTVYKVGDQDAVRIARMVRAYVAGRRAAEGIEDEGFRWSAWDRVVAMLDAGMRADAIRRDRPPPQPLRTATQRAYEAGRSSMTPLPPGSRLATSSDLARFIEGRLELLVRNARAGAVLVVLTLLLFLNWRTAFWVGVGLATALAGTLLFMKLIGTTLNLLTMFGLIVVLGLLVDDAIVVAENIQARHDRGEPAKSAAVIGTEQVAWPVLATVLTSIVAFLPLTFIRGVIGDLLGALPWVVACALFMSLVESLIILPSHMAHSLAVRDRIEPGRLARLLRRFETRRDRVILEGLVPAYARFMAVSLRYRYVSLAAVVAVLIVAVGIVRGGRLQFEFIPSNDSETVICEVDLPVGSPIEATERAVAAIEAVAAGQPEVVSISSLVGVQASVDDTSGVTDAGQGSHLGQLFIELTPTESRDRESSRVTQSIREGITDLVGIDRIEFSEIQGGPAGKDISIRVSGDDFDAVRAATGEVRALLGSFAGVLDVGDDDAAGQREVRIRLRPGAEALGVTARDVATQVRGALFGLDAHVFSAEREDIDVRVRLDERTRRNLHATENLWVIAPSGAALPLAEIAELEETDGYKTIRRVDRRRSITVSADTAPDVSPETVMPAISKDLAGIVARHPGIRIDSAGRQKELGKAFSSLPVGFAVAVTLIYVILAWLFGSYVQPITVMLAIPFGAIGVIGGHLLLGEDLTFMSLIGFVALSGIVVNDSLILVQFYNSLRGEGLSLLEALIAAGRQRLRPILLTTITTVLGLTPLMLEQSFQAKFLIPMAISISFGLISATVLILVVLPCMIVIFDDLAAALHRLWHGRPRGERRATEGETD